MSGALSCSVLSLVIFCGLGDAQQSAPANPIFKEGDAAFAKGDYDVARQSFEKARKIAERLPVSAVVRYDVLKRLTVTTAASGQFADAQAYLQQAIAWRELNAGPKDTKLADDWVLSINLYLRTKEFDQALAVADRVKAIHTAAYAAESIPVADDLLRIGQIYLAEKQPDKALRPLVTAHSMRTKLTNSLDPGLLPVLDKINEAFEGMGQGGNEPIYRQALIIRETLYGKDSPELINTVEGFANFYYKQSMFIPAEPLYLRLLGLWEHMVGGDHPMVAVTLDKLVVLYIKEGELKKARETLARSVDIRARFLAVGLSHQATDEVSQSHAEQAKGLYRRALAALGPPSAANQDLIDQIIKAMGEVQSSTTK